MAIPTGFKEANAVLNAPPGQEERVNNLPIVRLPGFYTGSVWELSPNELKTVFETGKIFIAVCAGGITQPPIFATAYTPGVPLLVAEGMMKNDDGNEQGG